MDNWLGVFGGGIRLVGTSGRTPLMPTLRLRFPGAEGQPQGGGTQGTLCRGEGRGGARLGAGRQILKGALFASALLATAGSGASPRQRLLAGS